jgi:hypothetical protein
VQAYILGLIDDAHPPAAELLSNAVVRNGPADHGLRLRHLARILGRALTQVNEGALPSPLMAFTCGAAQFSFAEIESTIS